MKLLIMLLAMFIATGAEAQNVPWMNPQVNEINREPMHAHFIPYMTEAGALAQRTLPDAVRFDANPQRERRVSLDGTWKFFYSKNNGLCPKDFHKANYSTKGWKDIEVPGSWELQGFDAPIYTDTRYPFPANPPYVPTDYNPVGAYVRDFTVPETWNGMDVFLDFEGVESAYYVWVNGQLAGYAEDSRLPSRFNITKLLKKGRNRLAVKVFRYSDGSYLEGQDYWKYSGIERSVYLMARPKSRVEDFRMTSLLTYGYKDGQFDLCLIMKNPVEGEKTVVKVMDGDKTVLQESHFATSAVDTLYNIKHLFKAVKQWNAETPNTYLLVVSTFDKAGKAKESFTHLFGFRTVEMRNGLQLINGKAIKFKGVNRHEHDAKKGRSVTVASMVKDLQLMKQFNMNAVRNSHYPNNAPWYELCTKYGMYLIGEANLETHGMEDTKDGTLANNPDWELAFKQRMSRMIARDRNCTAIVTWSMGNESGYGKHFVTLYNMAHALDNTRPVQYEGGGYEGISDIYCPMYARIWALRKHVIKRDARPLILCEYEHTMGNSGGNFGDYWDLIYKYDQLQGGFTWDWVDQTFRIKDQKGHDVWAFGGDMGFVGVVNDSTFCANGLVAADRSLHPHIYEIKKVIQYIGFEPVAFSANKVKITNRHDFITLDGYRLHWAVEADGKTIQQGMMDFPTLNPQCSTDIELPLKAVPADGREYFLTLRATTKQAAPLVPQGHEVATEQWKLPFSTVTQQIKPAKGHLDIIRNDSSIDIKSCGFGISFSTKSGEITVLQYDGKNFVKEGLQPNFWRPLIDNDVPNGHLERCITWKNAGKNARLTSIDVQEKGENATVTAQFYMDEQESRLKMKYDIRPDGALKVTMHYTPGAKALNEMPKFGMRMILPAEFESMTWLGRGPHESYEDRKSSALIGLYNATVWEQYHPYVRAQETANHCDTRWIALRNKAGEGILVTGDEPLSVSAWNFRIEAIDYIPFQIERRHGGGIEKQDLIWLNLDHKQMGVGGDNTWGAQIHPEYTITPNECSYSFTIQPLNAKDDPAAKAHDKLF